MLIRQGFVREYQKGLEGRCSPEPTPISSLGDEPLNQTGKYRMKPTEQSHHEWNHDCLSVPFDTPDNGLGDFFGA